MNPDTRFRKHPWPNIAAIIVAVVWLVPVYWMVNSAFQSESELMSWPPHLVPHEFTWQNFVTALDSNFFSALKASAIAATLTVLFASTGAILAAMALSRFRFRGRTTVSYTHLTLPTIHVECRSRWSPYH